MNGIFDLLSALGTFISEKITYIYNTCNVEREGGNYERK